MREDTRDHCPHCGGAMERVANPIWKSGEFADALADGKLVQYSRCIAGCHQCPGCATWLPVSEWCQSCPTCPRCRALAISVYRDNPDGVSGRFIECARCKEAGRPFVSLDRRGMVSHAQLMRMIAGDVPASTREEHPLLSALADDIRKSGVASPPKRAKSRKSRKPR